MCVGCWLYVSKVIDQNEESGKSECVLCLDAPKNDDSVVDIAGRSGTRLCPKLGTDRVQQCRLALV